MNIRPDSGVHVASAIDPAYANELSTVQQKGIAVAGTAGVVVAANRLVFGDRAVVMPALYTAAAAFPALLFGYDEPRVQALSTAAFMATLLAFVDKAGWIQSAKYGATAGGALYVVTQGVIPWARKEGYLSYF